MNRNCYMCKHFDTYYDYDNYEAEEYSECNICAPASCDGLFPHDEDMKCFEE